MAWAVSELLSFPGYLPCIQGLYMLLSFFFFSSCEFVFYYREVLAKNLEG